MIKTIRLAMLTAAIFSVAGATNIAVAQGGELAGSWSGGGTVTIAGGNRERARCRVRYAPQGGASYTLTGVCATDTGRVEQSATLRRTGGNIYSGTFVNQEFGVSGTIRVTVNGNSQIAMLNSDNGSAVLTLKRQ